MERTEKDGEESGTIKEDNNSDLNTEVEGEDGDDDYSADEVEETTAEVLMTDMTLDDDVDRIRDQEPGSNWLYHIEAYPWHGDDVNEHLIRLMKLASFTRLSMRKKTCHESEDSERLDDKLMERQRRGSINLYAENYQTAKSIMRHTIWKNMASKELTFEITKRCTDNTTVSARIVVDTTPMSKVKFRDKVKGNFVSRTAKVSNLPAGVTRDMVNIVFCRSTVVYDRSEAKGKGNREVTEPNLNQTLGEIPDFKRSLDIDCVSRGSCRAYILGLKSVCLMGTYLTITPNDPQIMVPFAQPDSADLQAEEEPVPKSEAVNFSEVPSKGTGQGTKGNASARASSLNKINNPPQQTARVHPVSSAGRTRGGGGNSRGIVVVPQPANASFPRSSQGMPVPMTGRQKMNEKIRRNHPNTGTPSVGQHQSMGASAGFRATNMRSIGDSFKQEIASLHNELERSTQAIEAKILRLTEESSYYDAYNEEMQVECYKDDNYEYEYDVNQEEYYDNGQNSYYMQPYDLQPHDTGLAYEPAFPMNRGLPMRRAGRAPVVVHMVEPQRMGGLMSSGRNPQPIRMVPRVRGRGGAAAYQGPSTSGRYW